MWNAAGWSDGLMLSFMARKRLARSWPDLLATAAAWAATILLAWGVFVEHWPVGWLLAGIFLISLGNLAWLPARTMPRLAELATRERREEIAVTLMPPADYLKLQLRRLVAQTLIPSLTVAPVHLALLGAAVLFERIDPWVVFCYGWSWCWLLGAFFAALAGMYGLLRRLCVKLPSGALGRLTAPVGWTLAGFVPFPLAALISWKTGMFGFFVGFVLMLPLLTFALPLIAHNVAVNRWKTLCRAYYYFD